MSAALFPKAKELNISFSDVGDEDSWFGEFPPEVLFAIIEGIPPRELCRIAVLNKSWYKMSNHNLIWKNFVHSRWEDIEPTENGLFICGDEIDWKNYFHLRDNHELIINKFLSVKSTFGDLSIPNLSLLPTIESSIKLLKLVRISPLHQKAFHSRGYRNILLFVSRLYQTVRKHSSLIRKNMNLVNQFVFPRVMSLLKIGDPQSIPNRGDVILPLNGQKSDFDESIIGEEFLEQLGAALEAGNL